MRSCRGLYWSDQSNVKPFARSRRSAAAFEDDIQERTATIGDGDEVQAEKKVGQRRLWTPARLTELEEGHPDSRGIPPSASTHCIKMPRGRLERNVFLI